MISNNKPGFRTFLTDKKGSYFHWIVLFGLMSAVAIFLFFGRTEIVSGPSVKGEWQLDFLKNNYLPAEKDLLDYDIAARKIGRETIAEIAQNGGYSSGETSACGKNSDNVNFWNDADTVCFPQAQEPAESLALEKINKKFPDNEFSSVMFTEKLFLGNGQKNEITADNAKYIYDTGFAVDVGYSFAEYETLKSEAAILIGLCWDAENLKDCLDENKGLWKYSSCNLENYRGENRKVSFCYDRNGIEYRFALDFNGFPQSLRSILIS